MIRLVQWNGSWIDHTIVLASKIFWESQKDDGTLCCDTHHDKYRENNTENWAKREAKLTFMPTDVFACLLYEKPYFLPTCQAKAIVITLIKVVRSMVWGRCWISSRLLFARFSCAGIRVIINVVWHVDFERVLQFTIWNLCVRCWTTN